MENSDKDKNIEVEDDEYTAISNAVDKVFDKVVNTTVNIFVYLVFIIFLFIAFIAFKYCWEMLDVIFDFGESVIDSFFK